MIITTKSRRMSREVQKNSGGCTASHSHLITAAAIEAAIVGAAGRGANRIVCHAMR